MDQEDRRNHHMSNIPKARERLLGVARRLRELDHHTEAKLIHDIVHVLLVRQSPIRRAPRKPYNITPSIRAEIKRLADTDMHIHEIGQRVGINPGRVSEIINGKR
jgi:hypothetical protein